MKQLFLNKSISFICKYKTYSEFEQKKLKYGLEGLYLTTTKMIILLILALLLNMFKEFILIIILFNIIRYTGFGFHAEKSYQCMLSSIFNFILIPYLLFHCHLSDLFIYVTCGVCIIHYILFAPADTVKRPLTNKKKRLVRKLLTVSTGIIYTLAIILLDSEYWTAIFLSALIIQAIIISPITYWIFGQPYNNYKTLNTELSI